VQEGRGRHDVASRGDPVEDALVACGREPIAVGHQHKRERAAGRLTAGLVWFSLGREMDDGVQCPVAMWVGEVADTVPTAKCGRPSSLVVGDARAEADGIRLSA
jgi:hypothetical protein